MLTFIELSRVCVADTEKCLNLRRMAVLCVVVHVPFDVSYAVANDRTEGTLHDGWEISTDDGKSWRSCPVPEVWEEFLGSEFDGLAIYRCRIPYIPVPQGCRLLVTFEAVATHARVFVNGSLLGEHIGGWTPFTLDMTDAMTAVGDAPSMLEVVVDERVGHLTQGFLPVITPHFGGIWQPVRWVIVPDTYVDPHQCVVRADGAASTLNLEIPVRQGSLGQSYALAVTARAYLRGTADVRQHQWQWPADQLQALNPSPGKFKTIVYHVPLTIQQPKRWKPDEPWVYRLQIEWRTKAGAVANSTKGELSPATATTNISERTTLNAAFREIAVDGTKILVHGEPLVVRGLLNWGLDPRRHGPIRDEEVMQAEIRFAEEYGFNLMKFCLWVPPQRYLELCDEHGLLVWLEYPTWHAPLTKENLPALAREYGEFFRHDHAHPCVVLRSLTCETGSSADLEVLQSLYDQCKSFTPNGLVVDDSSWIDWNRIHDFYDDHPYGNNDTWPATLKRLKRVVAERGPKPLVLGEAIAADTWPVLPSDPEFASARWTHRAAAATQQLLQGIQERIGPDAAASVPADSLNYALRMRKYQVETYRRDIPDGGYVVSVIRDFPLASMGLLDPRGKPKWPSENWAWHGDKMLLLRTHRDRFCFASDQPIHLDIGCTMISSDGEDEPLSVQIELIDAAGRLRESHAMSLDSQTPFQELALCRDEPPIPHEGMPERLVLRARSVNGRKLENEWSLWRLPLLTSNSTGNPQVQCHSSFDMNVLKSELPAPATPTEKARSSPLQRDGIILTHVIDDELLTALANGAVVFLIPNDQSHSFPTRNHWFLRGGPIIDTSGPLTGCPREFLLELQHFDLSGPVVPGVDEYLDTIQPLVILWDNHDLETCRAHGLLFQIPVGCGVLCVSSLNHRTLAGGWLFDRLIGSLSQLAFEDRKSTPESEAWLEELRRQIQFRETRLDANPWRFQPDPNEKGESEHWHTAEFDDADWPAISITRHWEAEGYPSLDGWAWYRQKVEMPEDWQGERVYLNFTGVDDFYRLYVNGKQVGTGGDLEKRQTAFDERKSFEITSYFGDGRSVTIAVQVFDWFGAGGIFRPVTLTTEPVTDRRAILK